MKNKSTKHALLASVLSIVMCFAMLIGSTFAWFTDEVKSGMNKIVAGNLDVELYHSNGNVTEEKVNETTNLFIGKDGNAILWEPGVMVYEKLTVKNAGSLALKYRLTLNSNFTVVDGKSLEDVLKVAIVSGEDVNKVGGDRATTLENLTFIKFSEAEQTGVLAADEAGKAGDTYAIVIYWEPSDRDNDYNIAGEELSVDLGVNLVATQAASEKDSFDNNYDSGADFPIVADVHYDAATSDDLIAALDQANEGETVAIHLKNDLVLDQIGNPDDYWKYHYKFSGEKEVIIDLAGNELKFSKPDGADYSFTGGILAENNSVTIANGTVNVDGCTGVYTTGTATSYFKNVTFNVNGSRGQGVQGVGYTEFDNCEFNVNGSYGLFCSRATKVTNCTFNVNSFGSAGVQMNTYCSGNVISNCKFNVSYGTAIYVNNNSDVEINNVEITLTGSSSVAGIHVDAENSFATIGENVTITNESTYYSPELVGGNGDLSNVRIADGFKFETDGELYESKFGASPSAKYEKGTFWRTVPST